MSRRLQVYTVVLLAIQLLNLILLSFMLWNSNRAASRSLSQLQTTPTPLEHAPHFPGGVQAERGQFVLVRSAADRVAFQFTEETDRCQGGAKFIWYQFPLGQARHGKNHSPVEGEVFENYRVVKQTEGGNKVENDGGELDMIMGSFRLGWSKSFTVYFPFSAVDQPKVEMALTRWTKVEDVDFSDAHLDWRQRTDRH